MCWMMRRMRRFSTLLSSLFVFVGLPNDYEWVSVSLTTKLTKDLERHEEWMQANVKSGFTTIATSIDSRQN
jgi:hypothetical protein